MFIESKPPGLFSHFWPACLPDHPAMQTPLQEGWCNKTFNNKLDRMFKNGWLKNG